MKTVSLNGKILKLYDSIDEMPIVNFQKYNKYLLLDSGIGSDADDVDAHIVKIARYIKAGSSEKALQELQNMRQNIYMINSELSPKYLAFAALIYSVDGQEVTDLSDDGLKALLGDIKKVKHSSLFSLLAKLKKKVETELELYFPNGFVGAREKEAYDLLKTRTLLLLAEIDNAEVDNSAQVATIDLAMLRMQKPKCFIGSSSIEIKYEKQFENACLLISQKTSMDAKKMTVLQFYNALETIKAQAEAEAKRLKPKK